MKFGPRKPNIKKRIRARTTGKVKRQMKKSINPLYGKKGMGWVRDPKRAAYNKIYHKTTFDAVPSRLKTTEHSSAKASGVGCLAIILLLFSLFFPPFLLFSLPFSIYSFQQSKKEQEKANYFQALSHDLAILEQKIQRNQEIKGLVPFFERMDEIQTDKQEVLQQIDAGFKKEYLTEEQAQEVQSEIKRVITLLVKDYIDRYESSAFETAMQLKTERGRKNNYQRSYEDFLHYSKQLTPEWIDYLNEKWRKIQ